MSANRRVAVGEAAEPPAKTNVRPFSHFGRGCGLAEAVDVDEEPQAVAVAVRTLRRSSIVPLNMRERSVVPSL